MPKPKREGFSRSEDNLFRCGFQKRILSCIVNAIGIRKICMEDIEDDVIKSHRFFAHSLEGAPPDKWQLLEDHLNNVAELAKKFAESFSNGDWAYLAGLLHDLGKYLPAWQQYLLRVSGYGDSRRAGAPRPNHSTAGAALVFDRLNNHPIARILGSIIAGHHAGLPDWQPDSSGGDLQNRIFNTMESIASGTIEIKRDEIFAISALEGSQPIISTKCRPSSPPAFVDNNKNNNNFEHAHLWVRMLFSCLVDADFLDTERFCNPDISKLRSSYPSLEAMQEHFRKFMDVKSSSSENTPVNIYRKKIYDACVKKAQMSPGFFTLTVPTGGGKTLSSMAFALRHAALHNKSRIIMAIPYTSIIEQTANVFRDVFGEDALLEHHSNIDPDEEDKKSRLATENWDAPIIVTTNVQLFESLLASRPSACRKLHNLVNSIIILDEAQMLPPEYLKPILSVLKGLVDHFGVTVVFCTATQPALCGEIGSERAKFLGISGAVDIVSKDIGDVTLPIRTDIQLAGLDIKKEWIDIAKELQEHEQVLCVVNTRKDCRTLHKLMPEGTIHLSANMCGEERSDVIATVKSLLLEGKAVRVVSTQLVEAGVDLDFPVVFRALAGVDSIAQAAGRCNREGKLNAKDKIGKVVVFSPPSQSPQGLLRKGEGVSRGILRKSGRLDLTDEVFSTYFKEFYKSLNDFDKPKFKERLLDNAGDFAFQFRTFADSIKLIDDTAQRAIIVKYKSGTKDSFELIETLRRKGPERWLLRRLQRFIVNVPYGIFCELQRKDHIEEIHGYWVQKSSGLYKPGYGLLSDDADWDNDQFMI